MSGSQNFIRVHANVDITVDTLQTIVANAKQVAGKDNKGIYRVDTAEKVSEIISKFLQEKNFERYVCNLDNY